MFESLQVRRFMHLAVAAAILATPATASVTAEQRAIFERASQKGAAYEATSAGVKVAQEARKRGDYEVLDYLIRLRDHRLIAAFADNRWEPTPPQLEARILEHFEDREIAATLIGSLHDYRSAELLERLYGDVSTLARWRARRRLECRAKVWKVMGITPPGAVAEPRSPYAPPTPNLADMQARRPPAAAAKPATPTTTPPRDPYPTGGASVIQGMTVVPRYEPLAGQPTQLRGNFPGEASGVGWAYKCNPQVEDDPTTDFDGRRKDADRTREEASAAAIALTPLPDVERRLAPLFLDVSLLPSTDWSTFGKRPAHLRFPVTRPMQLSWTNLFMQRASGPPWRDIAVMLDQIEFIAPSPLGPDKDSWSAASRLLALATLTGDRAATAATVTWIERAFAAEKSAPPETLPNLIGLLGPVVPEAQVDFSDVKRRILEGLPYAQAGAMAQAFAGAEDQNRSLREPSAVSLSRWIPTFHAPRLVPYLLAKGADPNGPMPRGGGYQRPLIVAASKPMLVTLLLDHGADVNMGRGEAMTALQAACSNPETVALLLKRGADVNARAYGGTTALHTAAIGCADCVRLLLAASASVKTADDQGKTPLHYAGRGDTAMLLLDAGADPNAEDREGASPYSLAIYRPANDPLRVALEAKGGRLSIAQRVRKAKQEAEALKMFGK